MARKRSLRIAKDLSLPVDAVTQTFGVLAKKGAGKTYTGGVMAEEMLGAGLQVVILDPTGAWWGLRSSADGKREGFPIIVMGGDRGDVPLEPTAGETIANLLIGERVSCVLDMSRFRKGEMRRFVTDFAERLYQKNRKPIHIFMDEADLFAPQRIPKGFERMLGAVDDIVRRGRIKGLGVTMITQRSAVISKDVLTQIECLIAMRITSPQDKDAVDRWIKEKDQMDKRDEMMASLPSLPNGTCYVWSPGWLNVFRKVKIRRKETFDSSATPKVGARIRKPKKLAPVDLRRITEQIQSTIQRAKQEDPRFLRQRIAELERELRKKKPTTSSAPVRTRTKTVEVPVISPAALRRVESMLKRAEHSVERLNKIAGNVERAQEDSRGVVNALRDVKDRLRKLGSAPKPAPEVKPALQRPPSRPARLRSVSLPEDERKFVAGERRMLATLASWHPEAITKTQLATLSGIAISGGSFSTYMSSLRSAGFIIENGANVSCSNEGLAYARSRFPDEIHPPEDLFEVWSKKLVAGERRMLRALIDHYPNWVTKHQLADLAAVSFSGGSFSTYLSTLRRNGLVEVEGDMVRAAQAFFMTSAVAG